MGEERHGLEHTVGLLLPQEGTNPLEVSLRVYVLGEIPKRTRLIATPPGDKLVLADFDSLLICGEDALPKNFQETNARNFDVPVIYIPDRSPPRIDDFRTELNLFAITPRTVPAHTLEEALLAREMIRRFRNTFGEEAQAQIDRLNPPTVFNVAAEASRWMRYGEEYRIELDQKIVADRHWARILENMKARQLETDPMKKEAIARELALPVARFLHLDRLYLRKGALAHLGEGIVGEDPVRIVLPRNADSPTRYIYRTPERRGNIPGSLIAQQRANDSRWLRMHNPEIPTAGIMDPLCLERYDTVPHDSPYKQASLLIMERAPGEPFFRAEEKLTQFYATERKRTTRQRIDNLRTALIEQYIESCASWCRNPPPLAPEFPKPSPQELVDMYRENCAQLLAACGRSTRRGFSELEEQVYDESTRIFERITSEPRHVRRILDSGFGNRLIGPKKKWTGPELLAEMSEPHGWPDTEKLRANTRQIDIQWKYGHVLEDLAQILTFYEARFLLYPTADIPAHRSRLAKQRIGKRLLQHRDEFLDAIAEEDEQLRADNLSFVTLLGYRAVRKLYLFFTYWEKSVHEWQGVALPHDPPTEDPEGDCLVRRQEEFAMNMKHYYSLARILFHEAGDLLQKRFEEEHGPEAGTLARELYDRFARKGLSETVCNDYLQVLTDPQRSGLEKDIIRSYGLRAILRRIGDIFKEYEQRQEKPLRYRP